MIRTEKDFFNVGENVLNQITERKPKIYDKYVDIYSFFNCFQKLLADLNLLAEDETDESKIIFRQEYPDETYKSGTVVVYKINERNFYHPKTTMNPSGTEQRKPLTLGTSSDIISNNVVDDYGYFFSNNVEFEIFSNSIEHLHTVTKLLESICLKYKKNLKLYVHNVLYKGQSKLEYSDKYFKKRLFSKSIHLEVITCETYSIVSEELKYIEIT